MRLVKPGKIEDYFFQQSQYMFWSSGAFIKATYTIRHLLIGKYSNIDIKTKIVNSVIQIDIFEICIQPINSMNCLRLSLATNI